jgi:hypothetical protein
MTRFNTGPILPWQEYPGQIPSSMKLLTRLYRSGQYGLPVGAGSRHLGGIKLDVAHKLVRNGLAYVSRNNKGEIVRIYPCQYSFNFYNLRH